MVCKTINKSSSQAVVWAGRKDWALISTQAGAINDGVGSTSKHMVITLVTSGIKLKHHGRGTSEKRTRTRAGDWMKWDSTCKDANRLWKAKSSRVVHVPDLPRSFTFAIDSKFLTKQRVAVSCQCYVPATKSVFSSLFKMTVKTRTVW